jgi:hypothetical protein
MKESAKTMQTTSGAQVIPVGSNRESGMSRLLVRVLVSLLLFCAVEVYESVHLSSLTDPDVWLHLRTGLWILQNHAVPHTALFSQSAQLPWIASSWGFDVLLAVIYKLAGLRAVPLTLMAFNVALAVSAFLLARRLGRNFVVAVLLAIAAQCALPALRPLPYVISIVCFSIELQLLFVSRRTGNVRILYWLPLLFVFWVNLHVQFVYGLVILCLFVAAAVAEDLCRRSGFGWCQTQLAAIPLRPIGVVAALSFAATLLSPYSSHIYEVVLRNSRLAVYIADEHSLNFRQSQHYLLLLLAMAAYFALGRRRSIDLFQLSLMAAASMLAFRIQGDAAFLAMASIAVIADASCPTGNIEALPKLNLGDRETLATAVLLVVVTAVAASHIPSSQEMLLNRMGESLPVRACDYIRQNRLPNPVFNEYRWGDFLTFYLPDYPVAIDDRTDLYEEETINRYFAETNGKSPLDSDPSFVNAQTILLSTDSAMAQALPTMPGFTAVYRDSVATVLVRTEVK